MTGFKDACKGEPVCCIVTVARIPFDKVSPAALKEACICVIQACFVFALCTMMLYGSPDDEDGLGDGVTDGVVELEPFQPEAAGDATPPLLDIIVPTTAPTMTAATIVIVTIEKTMRFNPQPEGGVGSGSGNVAGSLITFLAFGTTT